MNSKEVKFDIETEKINKSKKKMIWKTFQLSVENYKYLAKIKNEKGWKDYVTINKILDDFRENNYI